MRATERTISADALEGEAQARILEAGEGFESVVAPPFVVVSDGAPRALAELARVLVRAREVFRADFFATEPGEPLTIWAYKDRSSYIRGMNGHGIPVRGTPFYTITPSSYSIAHGMFSSCTKELFVDMGNGRRTLLHELVHAYVNADFPSAPIWLDEGLASLLEDPEMDEAGHVRGTEVTGQLAIVHFGLLGGNVPSFERLAHAGLFEFNSTGGEAFYSTARMLLCWLQEQNLVRDYYREHRSHAADDPTGLDALRRVTHRELAELRPEWELFVHRLWDRRLAGQAAKTQRPPFLAATPPAP